MNTAARSRQSIEGSNISGGQPASAAASIVFVDQSIQGSIRITESHKIDQKTRNDYCNRLDKMIIWIESQVTQRTIQISESLVRELSNQEKGDKGNYHNSIKDLNYEILPVEIVKAYISSNKFKPTSTVDKPEQYGFDHLRKNHDAVLYGASRVKKILPMGYKEEMKIFLDSLEKERTAARKRGELSEEEADPISFPLYRTICNYAVSVKDSFLWAFSVLIWSCMARPINIDDLSLTNISLGVDSVIIKFSDTKKTRQVKDAHPRIVILNR